MSLLRDVDYAFFFLKFQGLVLGRIVSVDNGFGCSLSFPWISTVGKLRRSHRNRSRRELGTAQNGQIRTRSWERCIVPRRIRSGQRVNGGLARWRGNFYTSDPWKYAKKADIFPLLFPFNFHFSTMTIAFIFKKRPEKFPWGKSGRALALHCFSKVSNIVVKECLF